MMKEYRVVVSYTVFDYGYVEAESAEQARELVESGETECDWKEFDISNWQIEGVYDE